MDKQAMDSRLFVTTVRRRVTSAVNIGNSNQTGERDSYRESHDSSSGGFDRSTKQLSFYSFRFDRCTYELTSMAFG